MPNKILGPLLLPIGLGIYHLFRRENHYAYGLFIGAILMLPVLYRMQDTTMPKNTVYIALGAFVVLTALELLYIRATRKKRGRKQ